MYLFGKRQCRERWTIYHHQDIAQGDHTGCLPTCTPANEETKFTLTLYGDNEAVFQNGDYT